MALTPEDIQKQEFHVRFRGFDIDEVDAFLEVVAEDYYTIIQECGQLREENSRLREQAAHLEKSNQAYRNQEQALKEAVLAAKKSAEEIKIASRQEAEAILARAQAEFQEAEKLALRKLEVERRQLDALRVNLRDELLTTLDRYRQQIAVDNTVTPVLTSLVAWPAPTIAPVAMVVQEDTADDFELYEKVELPAEPPATASPAPPPPTQRPAPVTVAEATRPAEAPPPKTRRLARSTPREDMLFSLEPLEENAETRGPAINFGEDENS
ncbi:MAG: hypothetical protein A2521_10470 [Deltaproteobacteria bacterium RIFOXYD12_FULL_57_12]|nr:MAG: hypothetical protein A2521_10470 [Deltaproteobacteria bacterium RIFOXYD12_FULL_57_12]